MPELKLIGDRNLAPTDHLRATGRAATQVFERGKLSAHVIVCGDVALKCLRPEGGSALDPTLAPTFTVLAESTGGTMYAVTLTGGGGGGGGGGRRAGGGGGRAAAPW